jgi:hypothetical protein
MPKAIDIANELIAFAHQLAKDPEAEIQKAEVIFDHFCSESKDSFLNLVKVFPRPFNKKYTDYYLTLNHNTDNAKFKAEIIRSAICEKVSDPIPAKYKCVPLLNEAEDAEIVE